MLHQWSRSPPPFFGTTIAVEKLLEYSLEVIRVRDSLAADLHHRRSARMTSSYTSPMPPCWAPAMTNMQEMRPKKYSVCVRVEQTLLLRHFDRKALRPKSYRVILP